MVDNTIGSSSRKEKLFYMSGEAPDGTPPKELLQLPFVFVYHEEGKVLLTAMERQWNQKRSPAVALISKSNDSPSASLFSCNSQSATNPLFLIISTFKVDKNYLPILKIVTIFSKNLRYFRAFSNIAISRDFPFVFIRDTCSHK